MLNKDERKGGPYWGKEQAEVGDLVLLGVEIQICNTVRSKNHVRKYV